MADPHARGRIPLPDWTDEELRTLIGFRRRHGYRWKSRLLDRYLFGKDDGEPDGAELRWIRNRQRPSRVHGLRRTVLDAAEERFAHDLLDPRDRR